MTDTPAPLRGYITITEAAAIMQVSERTLWRYLRRYERRLPRPVRVRGRLYFERSAVETWAREGEQDGSL